MIDLSILMTSYKEPILVRQAIKSMYANLKTIGLEYEFIVVAPDEETIESAEKTLNDLKIKNSSVIKDQLQGKPAALNLAFKHCKGMYILLTDGDVFVEKNSIVELLKELAKDRDIVAVGGNPISIENRNTMWGFYSHLFCSAANFKRQQNAESVQMTGYLYIINKKILESIFPLPTEIRAEDSYISKKILEAGKHYSYSKAAKVLVMFPKNTRDWLNQKVRSVGGAKQIASYFPKNVHERSLIEDLKHSLFPLKFAKNIREYIYLPYLYLLRFYLWMIIIYRYKISGFSKGAWKRIESSKY